MREPLDQPLIAERPTPPPERGTALTRYVLTLLLFPAALLRLREGEMDFTTLLTGGLYSTAQFLLAALLFVGLRIWRQKTRIESVGQVALLILRTAVDLVILVGVMQVLYQWFVA